MGSAQSTAKEANADTNKRQSLYQRYQEKKRSTGPSDEDILKYTGKTRDELNKWAETRPGVGGNQLAGSALAGPTSGLAGMAMADGLGGWGPSAVPNDANRGLKFPPTKGDDGRKEDTIKKEDIAKEDTAKAAES